MNIGSERDFRGPTTGADSPGASGILYAPRPFATNPKPT